MDQDLTIAKLFNGENRAIAAAIIEIIHDWRDYWPLTVRQVFYQCVVKSHVPNRPHQYSRVSRLLTTLRRSELVPWGAVEDRTRRTTGKRGLRAVDEFIKSEVSGFLNPDYYGRCYIQEQEHYVEVATEKDALSSILEDAVWYYCTRLNVVRGQVSASMVKSMADRFDRAIMLGQKPVLVYLGDLDPSGVAIPKALVRNLEDHHGVSVELVRAALNPDQIRAHQLPESLDAAKTADPNYKAWLLQFGPEQKPVELDAVPPDALKQIVTDSLDGLYDMSAVAEQKRIEAEERRLLKTMRQEVMGFMQKRYPEVCYAS